MHGLIQPTFYRASNCNCSHFAEKSKNRKEINQMDRDLPIRPRRRLWVIAFLLVALMLLSGGYWYYRTEMERIRQEKYATLAAVGKLKAGQIQWWLKERLADAGRLSKYPLFINADKRLLVHPANRSLRALLQDHLNVQLMGDVYSDILLTDAQGKVLLAARSDYHPPGPETLRAIDASRIDRRAVFSDLYRCPKGAVHQDTVAPVLDGRGRLLSYLILRSNVEQFLFPLIQSWPTPSATAETLLVKREGDEVVFLNELRHRTGAALALRFPLARTEIPAVQAVLGRTGIFLGRDYRGVEVIADLRLVAGTNWFMVAKVDAAEILAEAADRVWMITGIVAILILLAGLAMAFYYRRRQVGLYQQVLLAQRDKWEAEGRLKATFYSIGDAVIATDADGLIRQMNPVAEELTGWREAEAQDKPLAEIFRIVNEETLATVENPVQRALREGLVVGLANHTLLIARDGTRRPIADSAAPIHDEKGSIIGVVMVFRDQTEERAQERAREESELRYRTLADSGSALIWTSGTDGKCDYLNMPWLNFRGRTLEQELGDGWLEGVHPDDMSFCIETYTTAFDRRESFSMDYRLRRHDGEYRWIQDDGLPRYDSQGNFLGYIGYCLDITGRKQAEENLRENQLRLSQTIDFLPDATFVIDAQGKVIAWNRAIEELTGIAAAHMLGQADYAYAIPFYGHRRPVMIDLALNPDDKVAQSYASYHREEGRIVSESHFADFQGRGETWLWNTASILYGPDGRVMGAIESIRDITERKQAEREVRESLSLLGAALESTADGILIVDKNGRITRWNQKFAAMWKIPPAVLLSQDDVALEYIRPQLANPDEFLARVRELYAYGDQASFDYIEFRDGRVFERYSQPQKIGDDIVGRVWSFHDISQQRLAETERRKIEAQFYQAQKMEAVGRLAGGIAHDFNNMLNVIIGQAELAAKKIDAGSPCQGNLEEIAKAARRSADLVRQLLGFARKQTIAPLVLDLNDTVEDMLKMLRRLIGEDIDLLWKPAANLWPVKIDPSQVSQLLANLVVNARDAISGNGKIVIETDNAEFNETYCGQHAGFIPGQYVLLAVSDDGCGMDKETMDLLFEPFFTTKPLGQGTGLGLATVYGIVKQNNGFINVYSEPLQGSTLKIYLPRVRSELTPQPECQPGYEMPHGSETVLLVEDEPALLEIGEELLQYLGYKVIIAASPNQAIQLAKEYDDEIHLLLTDVVMPEMSGRELGQKISALRPAIKILFMSGYTANVIAHQGVLDEGVHFLQKPFSLDDMALKIRKVLESA